MCVYLFRQPAAFATSLPEEAQDESKLLCGPQCESSLDQLQMQTTSSGLQYKDIKEGSGPSPPVGFQVTLMLQY